MVKLLHYWLSRLTLFCLLAFAAGGAYAQMTIDVKVEGNGSATLSYMDMSVGTDLIPLALETKTYEFGATVYDGFMLSVQEGTLLSVEVNGELKEGYLPGLNAGQTQLISFGKTDASLKLVFSDDGGVEPVEKTNMTINLSVEGGEADVTYRAMLANGTTVNEAFELGENKLNLFKNAGSGYVVNIYVEAKDGYAVKEVYLNEQLQGNPSAFYISTQEDNQVYDIRVVCEESEPEPVYTQTYNVTINGEGAATYSYQDAATGQRTEYAPLASGTYNWNVLANSSTGKYYVSIKTTPADGYVLSSITANGENVNISAAAYGQAVSVGSTEPVVDLVITFAPVVTAEDFTFNFEVEGEGSMQFGPFMGTGFKYEDKAIANGDTYTYSTSDLTDSNGWYVSLRGIDGQATPNLAGVYINGVLNESVTDILQEQNATYFSVPKDVNPATIKLVFEAASAQVNGVIHCEVTGDVEASATLTYVSNDFSVNIKKDFVNGQDAVFENLDLDGETEGMYVQITGITPGEELTDILVNGVRDEEAWESFEFYRKYGQYNTGVTISPSNGGYDATVTLVFGESEPEPEYDFLINLTVEGGEADVKAQYTGAEGRQTVDLVEGPNYISGITAGLMNRRGVTILASDAEGYVIKEIYVNDEAKTVGRAFQLQSTTVPVEYDLRVVCEGEEPQPEYNQTYNIEIEGEGTVEYQYQNKDLTQGTMTGSFVEGPNYFNVFANMDGTGYKVDIYPKAAQGYELSDIQFDGHSDTYALDEVKANGFFSNVTEAETTNIKFVFTEAGPVTQTYNVTINGEGCSATYSYTDATSGEEVSGPLTNGSSVGMNPYYSETSGYWVYITPVPAEGYDLVSATANGAEVDILQWQYMKQHFIVKCPDATVDLVLNFEPLAAEDFTVKFEVEGEGGQLRFGPYSMDLKDFDYQPVENGSELSYAVKKLLADSQGYYVGLEMNDGEGKAVNQVLVNGVLDEEVTSGLQTLDKAYFYLPADVNPATIKVVFGEPAPDYTQIYKINIEGEGTLMGTYTDAESGDELEIEMLDGETYQLNIYKSSRGYYNLTLRPEAAGGYTLADIKVNGQTDMQAMFDVNNYGYFNSQVEAFGATTEITVVFDGGSQPEYLQTYNVTVIGNGKASYIYYPADGSGTQRGELTDGAVIGMNPPLNSNGSYEIYIDVEPADGEELVSITANGEEVDLGAYWAVGINPIVAYTTGETVDLVIEFTDNASPGDEFIYGFNVEVEGEGTVDYYYANSLPEYLRGTFELGVLNKFNDVWHSSFGGYWMNIIPVPAAGWKVDAVYSGGTALEFDEENQWYEVNTETAGTVFDIKVVFVEDVKDFDVAVNLTVEGGEADVTYTYYTVDDQEMTGTVNAGMNEYSNVAYSESLGGYTVDLNVTAAEGSMVKEIYVDGVLSQYGTDFASLVSTEKGHVFEVRVVCEQAAPEEVYTITMKATGNEEVSYYINLSIPSLKQVNTYYSAPDEDVTVTVPKSATDAYFSWNRNVPSNYTFRDFLVNGESIYDVSTDGNGQLYNISGDVELELVFFETEYYVLTYDEPEGGEIIIEIFDYWDMNVGDYVARPYEDGELIATGTEYRVTFYADEEHFLTGAYVNDEKVFEAPVTDEAAEYEYTGTVWGETHFRMETVLINSVDGVYAEPVQMYVYSVDGMLIRSCMAKSVDEAVDGLAQGLYIVNGEKVLVEE